MSTCEHRDCTPTPSATAVGRLCGLHYRALQADCADIARALDALAGEQHLDLIEPTSSGQTGASVPSSRPPIRLAAIVGPSALGKAAGWAEVIADLERTPDPVRAGRILVSHVEQLAQHPEVRTITEELDAAAQECRAVWPDEHWNTAEQDARPQPLARCVQGHPSIPDRLCGGPVHWVSHTVAVRCHQCGWEQEGPDFLPKRLVLAAWGISRRTLDRWIATGRVACVNRLVSTDDVRAAVLQLRHATGTVLDD